MTADWIIGRGLLGNAVSRRLGGSELRQRVRWGDDEAALADLSEGLDALYARPADDYRLYWCAGSGVTSTGSDVLDREQHLFARFLETMSTRPAAALERTTVFLASSVGGAYAGASPPPFTESSAAAAASAYGETKLSMERSLAHWAQASGFRAFIGRITNLYGPGQKLGKRQGLISVMCETYISREPATVYVSLDTLRDYIFEDDCAAVVVAGTRRASTLPPGSVVLKIIGAGYAVSIGELIGTITRVRRQRPLVAFGAGNSAGQAPDLRIRSEVWTDLDALVQTSLPAGVSAVLASLSAASAIGVTD